MSEGKPWVKVQDIDVDDCDAWLEENAATGDIRLVASRGDKRHIVDPAKIKVMLEDTTRHLVVAFNSLNGSLRKFTDTIIKFDTEDQIRMLMEEIRQRGEPDLLD